MDAELLTIWLATGAIIGWIASAIATGRGFGLAGNIFVGVSGAPIGSVLLRMLTGAGGYVAAIIGAAFGAVIFTVIARMVGAALAYQRPAQVSPVHAASQFVPIAKHRLRGDAAKKIFICYRRNDSRDVAGRIYDRLIAEFGDQSVFRDVDSVPIGLDFRKHIDQIISNCDICLVLIGSDWLTSSDGKGRRRIDDPKDHVRIEIESALKRAIPVVPLLIGSVQLPQSEELPQSIQDLAFRNGLYVRPDPDFHRDVDRLVTGLKQATS